LIQRGQTWQDEKRHTHRTLPVTLRRAGEVDVPDIQATRGVMPIQSLDGSGSLVTEHAQDFIIRVVDYAFGGIVSPPAEHDKILDSTTGADLVFEVLPVAGEPAARHTNSYGVAWRIHTMEVVR